MRYRIKIKTYNSGRQEFVPQVKSWTGWLCISNDGSTFRGLQFKKDTRQAALYCIDNHFRGNHKMKSIEFEYIDKQ